MSNVINLNWKAGPKEAVGTVRRTIYTCQECGSRAFKILYEDYSDGSQSPLLVECANCETPQSYLRLEGSE